MFQKGCTVMLMVGVLSSLLWNRVCADTIVVARYSYAAVAYSPSTDKFAYSYGHRSRSAAEKAALERCRADDARIAGWVNNGFVAFAKGDEKGAWGCGYDFAGGASNTTAMRRAIAECEKRTTGSRVVLCLTSDGQYIYNAEAEKK